MPWRCCPCPAIRRIGSYDRAGGHARIRTLVHCWAVWQWLGSVRTKSNGRPGPISMGAHRPTGPEASSRFVKGTRTSRNAGSGRDPTDRTSPPGGHTMRGLEVCGQADLERGRPWGVGGDGQGGNEGKGPIGLYNQTRCGGRGRHSPAVLVVRTPYLQVRTETVLQPGVGGAPGCICLFGPAGREELRPIGLGDRWWTWQRPPYAPVQFLLLLLHVLPPLGATIRPRWLLASR
ncbi:hypothetical protein GGR56DRAFT_612042 [Xylariaceae sp. FL0804]|nr:hypothetical protein GGR56DRAFT_612042 [Xylariaceae sp. FL0804]